jgi:uncharacterized protein
MSIHWLKPQKPIAQFIFAHGAGAGMDSDFMQSMATHLCELNIQVGLFNFQYMQIALEQGTRRPPDRAPKLLSYFSHILDKTNNALPLFIGGKSMGGRMASILASQRSVKPDVKGVIAMGYPFHPPGKPDKLRVEHFGDMGCPFLVIQGERDTFGNASEVAHMQLGSGIDFKWLEDGDHSLKPRKKSGFTETSHRLSAAQSAAQFICKHC